MPAGDANLRWADIGVDTDEHGIDMSLRNEKRLGGITGFWRSLLCFQETVPRPTRPQAPHFGGTRTLGVDRHEAAFIHLG